MEDSNPRDDTQEVDIEIVDRSTKVLLFAGGPMREYRFLRTQLFRDATTTVDVYLQSASAGISQEADRILTEFPRKAEELYEYDCILAFDPAWHALDQEQLDLLEKWVADEAGGLVVFAGPVHTQSWTQVPNMEKIRALYPVDFEQRLSLLDDGRFGSTEPWPVEFNRAGMEAEFLWLADTATESSRLWDCLSRRLRILCCARGQAHGHGLRTLLRPRVPWGPKALLCTWQGSSMGPGGCSTWVAAKCGGSAVSIRRRSKPSTPSSSVMYPAGGCCGGSSRGTLLVERDRYVLGQNRLSCGRSSPTHSKNP